MTPKQYMLHSHLVKICHTLKKNRFSDDDTRRDFLKTRFAKNSFKELTINELQEVAKFLGYYNSKKYPAIKNIKITKNGATKKQVETIEGIWFEIARIKTDAALREFIYKIVKKRPLYIGTLSKKEAQDIINALMAMQRGIKNA